MKHVVRIIAGDLKGHHIHVPSMKSLRPTPDRIKETVFNWLGSFVKGAKVLDLFAGSGSLGFEAISRGCDHTTFVERHAKAAKHLKEICTRFKVTSDQATIVCSDAISWLRNNRDQWDVVFVDPPFTQDESYRIVLNLLPDRLSPEGVVYVEHSRRILVEIEPFSVWRSDIVGEVEFLLLELPKQER